MQESTLTVKGQTTLPKDVRKLLQIKPGDKLRYLLLDGEVRILKALPANQLKGLLKRPGQAPVSLTDMDEAIAQSAVQAAK